MPSSNVNIAISGLGIKTSTELKINLRRLLPDEFCINWISINDENIDCLFINEVFFDHQHIQNLIQNNAIPFLKISKKNQDDCPDPNTLTIPLTDANKFQEWVNLKLLNQIDHTYKDNNIISGENKQRKDFTFFNDIYNHESGKLHITDKLGTVAIIDHKNHLAWLEPSRTEISTDQSIQYQIASTNDFIKVSRKIQFNLENWLFHLIWNTNDLIDLPEIDQHYKINYCVQPLDKDRKIILQLSASFMLGARIMDVANRFNISSEIVQKFIAGHLAIQNAYALLERDCKFGKKIEIDEAVETQESIKSFFKNFKRKFGF